MRGWREHIFTAQKDQQIFFPSYLQYKPGAETRKATLRGFDNKEWK